MDLPRHTLIGENTRLLFEQYLQLEVFS